MSAKRQAEAVVDGLEFSAMSDEELKHRFQTLMAESSQREYRARIAQNSALVGQCFKYHNTYGGDSKKWWLYAYVTGLDDCGRFQVWKIQRTSRNSVELETDESMYQMSGWVLITRREFLAGVRRILKYANTLPKGLQK